LKVNTTLAILDLSSNNIDSRGSIALSQSLILNTTLTKLYLSSNLIGSDGSRSLLNALKINTTITTLDLGTYPPNQELENQIHYNQHLYLVKNWPKTHISLPKPWHDIILEICLSSEIPTEVLSIIAEKLYLITYEIYPFKPYVGSQPSIFISPRLPVNEQ